MENENIFETENIEETTEVSVIPQIIDEFKYCIYCNEKIDADMNFCSFCGKSQTPGEEPPKKDRPFNYTPKKKIKRKGSKKIVLGVCSWTSFAFSFIAFSMGLIRLLFFNRAVVSFFSSNSEQLIVNQTAITGNLLISLIFLILGIFLDYKK